MAFLIVLAALVLPDVRGLSRLQRHPVRARSPRCGAVLLTDPSLVRADVHRPVHGQDGRLPEAVLPGVPARRGVRQADRAVGLFEIDRRRDHSPVRRRPGDAVDRAGLRAADLRRRVAVRGGVRGLSVRRRAVPPERHPQAPDPRHHRARRVHLHDGCAARHAADPEHHSQRRSSAPTPGRRRGWARSARCSSSRWA